MSGFEAPPLHASGVMLLLSLIMHCLGSQTIGIALFVALKFLKLRMALVFPLCTKPGQNISGSRTVSRVHTAQHVVQGMEFLGQP